MDVKDLAPLAIVFVILTIVISMGTMITAELEPSTYDALTVNNETHNLSTDPETITVDKASNEDFVELTDVTCWESTSQTTEIDCNISDAEAGKIEASSTDLGTTESFDYDYDEETKATGTVQDGQSALGDFSGWFPILVVVIISAVIIGIVMRYFGGMGQKL